MGTNSRMRRCYVFCYVIVGCRAFLLNKLRTPCVWLFLTKEEEMENILSQSDPYKILNLEVTTDKKEIKRAYRRMAMKFHPDVVSTDKRKANEVFVKVNAAYESLTGKGATSTTSRSSYN